MGYYKQSIISVMKLFLMYTYFNFTIEKLGKMKMNVGDVINWFNLRNFQPFIHTKWLFSAFHKRSLKSFINDKLFEVL